MKRYIEGYDVVTYALVFDHTDKPGCGFAFPCDEHGTVDIMHLHQAGIDNYRMCQRGEHPVRPSYVERREQWVPGYTLITCCGRELRCDDFTNTCDRCGRDYNWNGDQLAPRSQWGDDGYNEDGSYETAADILMDSSLDW